MIRRDAMRAGRGLRRAVGLLAVGVLVVPIPVARAEIANRIVATVDGEPVTAHELRRYGRDHGVSGTPDQDVLDALITDKLLEKEIKAQGINARDDEIDRYIQEIQTRNGMDEARFKEALAAQGMTWDAYRARVKAEIEKAQLVHREVRQRVNVSPEDIRRYYDAHPEEYGVEERVRVCDILFRVDRDADSADVGRTLAKAEEVRRLALDGRDFAALAKQFSEGPGADKGGEIGVFGRGEMEKALDQAAFALRPGQVSEPVRTDAGFHLLRVDERIAAGHRRLEDVKEEIRGRLYNEQLEQRFQNWMSRDLRERHHVEVLD
jgi:peptidyl-prolyl cis-trans isomerase SurA